jgi:hypothetical protein
MQSLAGADAHEMQAPSNERYERGRRAEKEAEAASREGLLKARLSTLLEALGELPGGTAGSLPDGAPGTAPVAGHGLGRVLDEVAPAGTIVLHNKKISGFGLELEHIVVAPRGLVIVSPEWAPSYARLPKLSVPTTAGAGMAAEWRRLRSSAVRGALRRAHACRTWLERTPWAGAPVLAAVCLAPVVGAPPLPPVFIDGLWLGPVERLAPWLAAGLDLAPESRAALGYYLAG